MRAMNFACVGRCVKSPISNRSPPTIAAMWSILVWRIWRSLSRRPSSCISSSVEGWMVSPRKSRKKSLCFSRTVTGSPERASRRPSITPAGPPPMMHVVCMDSLTIDAVTTPGFGRGVRGRSVDGRRLAGSLMRRSLSRRTRHFAAPPALRNSESLPGGR